MDWNALGDWLWLSLRNLSDIAPLATLLAVVIAFLSYRGTLKQKTQSDDRNAWWSRVQWALDSALSDDPQRRETGLVAIEHMHTSPWATSIDLALLRSMARAVMDETLELGFQDDPEALEPLDQEEQIEDNGVKEES
ncbi:hypothetical protein [Neomicrococcus lactis]|uniref:hypothetical protein n=1 Tax=Neomicrococcus lactis TaxID=732241 RepID=UPI0022FFEC52|nr:hypothetical protein [Neomicrococcus lactis]